jgi:hypothetical protein
MQFVFFFDDYLEMGKRTEMVDPPNSNYVNPAWWSVDRVVS